MLRQSVAVVAVVVVVGAVDCGCCGGTNFRTVDFGGAFFNRSYCVRCVLSDTWLLRCMMFLFCVKETDLGMMAFAA